MSELPLQPAVSASVPPQRFGRRWRWLGAVLLVTVAAVIGVSVWPRRAPPPPLPAIDLTRADPEVSAAVKKALDRVAADRTNAATWGELGVVLRAHDFDRESIEALRTAERLDPSEWQWPYLGGLTTILFDPDAGLDSLRRAADRSPAERSEPRLRLAEALFERGKLDEAESIARPLLGREQSAPRASLVLSRIAAERADWGSVLALTDDHRDNPSCRKRMAALRGDALQRLGRSGPAGAEWDRARALPDDAAWPDPMVEKVLSRQVGTTARIDRAGQLLHEGQRDAAVELLREVVQTSPNHTEARLLLGQALNTVGAHGEARRELQALTAQAPDSVEGWFQLGVAEFQTGDVAAAAEAFSRVVKLKPDHGIGHFNLGHARKKLGDRAGAVASFEAAIRCRPDHEPSKAALRELASGK